MNSIKDYFLFLCVFIVASCVLFSCNNQDVTNKGNSERANNTDSLVTNSQSSSEEQDNKEEEKIKVEDEATGRYANYPKEIKAENARRIDSNNILHIDLLDSQIPISQNKKTVEELFPECEVSYNEAKIDYFDVFDIKCQDKTNYTALVSYEESLEGDKVIAFIFVKNTEFSMEMVRHLFKL